MFETISPDPVSPLNPRKIIMVAAALAAGILFLCTPLTSTCYAADKNTPRLYLGYVFTTHHTPLMVAVDRGDAFKNQGAFLKPIVPRQKYELMDGAGKSLAVINFIVSKSGSETVTLFAQGRMDIGLASGTAFIK
jgi:NitT/TauT family transport system substrate-binding protein